MSKTSQKSEKEVPKGENPPMEKVVEKIAAESGKTFQGKGKEIKK